MSAANSYSTLDEYMIGQCDATKAKYAAELEHANSEWQKPLDLWYADTLVDYFRLLERNIETLLHGPHPAGCRITYRRIRASV